MTKETDKTDSDSPKRLKESEWIVISHLWERGEVTLKELSEQFGISEAALSQGLKRRGIKRGAKAHLAHKEIEAKGKEEREKMVEEIYHFKKKFLRYGDFLMTLTMNQLTEAKKEGKALSTKRSELDAIHAAAKTFKVIRNDMYHLYNLYDGNPEEMGDNLEFNIGVYSEKELEELKKAQELFTDLQGTSSDDEDNDFDKE